MQIFLIVVKVIPYVLALVKLAEQVFANPGSGDEKKSYVTEATKIFVDGVTDVSTGGQKETWERIGPFVSKIIDAAAGIYFPSTHKPSPPDAG